MEADAKVTFKIWGAAGGGANGDKCESEAGGGGFAQGDFDLKKGDKIMFVVGGGGEGVPKAGKGGAAGTPGNGGAGKYPSGGAGSGGAGGVSGKAASFLSLFASSCVAPATTTTISTTISTTTCSVPTTLLCLLHTANGSLTQLCLPVGALTHIVPPRPHPTPPSPPPRPTIHHILVRMYT
jgi:hypothetical protein